MSEFSLPVIDKSLQKTRLWLDDVMAAIETTDRTKAYRALKAVLHSLRDQLQVDEAVHFGAQMPLLVRGLFYEGWIPTANIGTLATVGDFLEAVAEEFGDYTSVDLERISRSVFRVVAAHISEGEVRQVLRGLPDEVRDFLTVDQYRVPAASLHHQIS